MLMLQNSLHASDAFVVAPPATRALGMLRMLAPTAPSPPPAQVKVVPSTVSTAPETPSNLPSQKELSEKISQSQASTPAPAPAPAPKSTNIASGTGIAISDIHYDGAIPKTESDEYVVISNVSNSPVDVSGYYIYVATTGTQGPTFYFPKGSTLKPGASVRIYTNEIHKDSGGYSFGSGKAVWSNNGGLGVLKDPNGKKLMEYKYKPAK